MKGVRVFSIFDSMMMLFISLTFIGCATYLTLRPHLEDTVRGTKLKKTIGVHFSPEFQNYQYVADPYGNMHSVYFPVGSASVALLDETIAAVFENRLQVDDLHSPIDGSRKVDAIIFPEIKEFAYYSKPAGGWHYWAKIRYSFSIYSSGGDRITGWEVTGTGTSAYGGVFDEKASWARAAESAMRDAAAQFRASFEVIPEAIRWVRNMTTDSSLFDIEVRDDRLSIDVQDNTQICSLDDIISFRIVRSPGPDSEWVEINKQLNAKGLLILSIHIQNQSTDEIRLFSSDIRLQTAGGMAVGPIPRDFFTAVATTYHGRLPTVSTGTHWGALTNLLFALANASALTGEEAEKTDLAENLSGELRNVTLGKRKFINGLLFFSVLPGSVDPKMELLVPLVIPSRAIRYRVWLPVLVRAGG